MQWMLTVETPEGVSQDELLEAVEQLEEVRQIVSMAPAAPHRTTIERRR